MNIFNIQSLISKGRVAKLSDIDPEKAYVQVGVYQNGNRPIGSGNANTYKECAVPLSELGQGGGAAATGIVVIKKENVRLFTSAPQVIAWPDTGLYIVQSAYITNASEDLSSLPQTNLQLVLPNAVPVFKTWSPTPIPGADVLATLFTPDNFAKMLDSSPLCFTPPCNGNFVYDAALSAPMYFEVEFPTLSNENVDVYIQLLKIA